MNRPATRIVLTLLLGLAAALLCVALQTPVPWMVGPLLSTALLAMTGGPAASAIPLRNTGQWVIGGALGLYFTPQVLDMLLGLWWVISLGVLWALVLGFLAGEMLLTDPAVTTYLGVMSSLAVTLAGLVGAAFIVLTGKYLNRRAQMARLA